MSVYPRIKMKNIKYHTVPKSNTKNVERGKFHTPSTQIHECSLPWLGTGTSIKKWRYYTFLVWITDTYLPTWIMDPQGGPMIC